MRIVAAVLRLGTFRLLPVLMIAVAARAQDLQFTLVAVAAPSGTGTVLELPASLRNLPLGGTFFLELWVSDIGTTNSGVSSAYVDLAWPPANTTAVSIDHGSIYDTLPSGTIAPGMVDELGGSALSASGVGIQPEWARAAIIELTADNTGDAEFTLAPSTTGAAALNRGLVPLAAIGLAGVTVTFRLLGDVNCDGAFNGADIDPFFLALGDPAGYATAFPDCDLVLADMNCDGAVNGADIDAFFLCLGLGGCICP